MKPRSKVVHQTQVDLPAGNRPIVGAIHPSVKYSFDDWASLTEARSGGPGFYYSRSSNPTVRQLELAIANLQCRDDAVAVSSGMAAISTCLLTLLGKGDHIFCFSQSYSPGRQLIRDILVRYGIRHSLLSLTDMPGLKNAIETKRPKALFFEAPTNPINYVPDINAITKIARSYGVLTILDNTVGALHNHGNTDIDYFVHSLTKFAGGHSDALAGAIIANSELIKPMRKARSMLGCTLDPNSAFLISRGLKTYFVRHEQQCRAAAAIADYLNNHPRVTKVHYPGLPCNSSYAVASKQMEDFGTIVSFDLDGTLKDAEFFVDNLEIFEAVGSLGSVHSLAIPTRDINGADLSDAELADSGITDGTIRLCLGLEDIDDLKNDLARAFDRVGDM